MIVTVKAIASNSASVPAANWFAEANSWITDQGGWLALLGFVLVLGPLIFRAAPIVFPIPLVRRKRAWELLKRLGDIGEKNSNGFGSVAGAFVLREEAYDAVRRNIKTFLACCLIFYPLAGLFMFFVASQIEPPGTSAQLLVLATLVLLGSPAGVVISVFDARWNRRVLEVIDEILLKDNSGREQLLISPAAAITEQCTDTGREDLMAVKVKEKFDRLKTSLDLKSWLRRFRNKWKFSLAVRELKVSTHTRLLELWDISVAQRENELVRQSKRMEENQEPKSA